MSRFTPIFAFIFHNKWRLIIAAVIILPILLIVWFATKPTQPTYVTEKAVRGDLTQTVEAVGTVISDHDLKLQFPSSGIVSSVSVKEGDTVKAGQTLATLRSGNLSADIASAQGRVLAAQATLQALQEGSRPQDIAISEADVLNKQSSLNAAKSSLQNAEAAVKSAQENLTALKQQADTSLSGYVTTIGSENAQQLTTADIALSSMIDIFSNIDVADALIKYGTSEYDVLRSTLQTDELAVRAQQNSTDKPVDIITSIAIWSKTRDVVQTAANDVDRTYALISKLPVTSAFSESTRSSYKDIVSAQRSTLQSALTSLDSTLKTLRDASASFTTQIAQQQSSLISAQGARDKALADIATYQASLQISQAQLELKRAPARQTDLNSAAASLQQARGSLAAAVANYQNTVLTAPIGGVITKVNLKTGEIAPAGEAITMLGTSPYRIEMYVSEIDIPKVALSQTGSVELDAFRGTRFKLHVSEIDSAATDKDGVSKYRIRLDFNYPHDDLKVGMTGDSEIDTGLRTNVVSVPLRAVIQNAAGQKIVRIMKEDNTIEERIVTTGMEGTDGNVEIVNGVAEAETVVVLEKK